MERAPSAPAVASTNTKAAVFVFDRSIVKGGLRSMEWKQLDRISSNKRDGQDNGSGIGRSHIMKRSGKFYVEFAKTQCSL